jgi:hypothetical protein
MHQVATFFQSNHTIPAKVYHERMSVKIPAEVLAAMREVSRKFGRLGGKTAAKNMTPEERAARARKASEAAAQKRTTARLERERAAKRPPLKRASK